MPDGVGGWQGAERSLGGLSRTFGLQNKNIGPGGETPVRIERVQLLRVARYFAPYWRQWLVIFLCIAVGAALGVLPPLAVRGILDQAIPGRNLPLLYYYVGAIIGLTLFSGLINLLQNYINAR